MPRNEASSKKLLTKVVVWVDLVMCTTACPSLKGASCYIIAERLSARLIIVHCVQLAFVYIYMYIYISVTL